MTTRIYLPSSSDTPELLPAADAAWEDTSILTRIIGSTTKTSSAMSTVAFSDANTTLRDILFFQYILKATVGQTLQGTDSIRLQIRGIESNASNNMFIAYGVRILNGTTVQKTVQGVASDGAGATPNELDVTTLTNRGQIVTGAATDYVFVTGDYLVIEIGTSGDPAGGFSHGSSLRIGDADAADLPGDDSDQTDKNPWIEFTASTMTFQAQTGGGGGGGIASGGGPHMVSRRRRI